MRTESIEVYEFNELSDDAKQNAISWWRDLESQDPSWASENRKTLKRFEEIFPIESTDWEYGYHNYINYKLGSGVEPDTFEFTGIRLLKFLVNNYWNDLYKGKYYSTSFKYVDNKPTYKFRHSNCQFESCCPLTGYCMDEDILQPIHDFMKNPNENTTFEQLLYECLQSWIYACRDELEASLSDENIIENIEANSYEFYTDGSFYG